MWSAKNVLYFSLASALGAMSRLALGECFGAVGQEALQPYAVFLANVLGCFFFGFFWVLTSYKKWNSRIILVGFMGSFTTFSSYIYDVYTYILAGEGGHVLMYGIMQIVVALLFLRFGMVCMQNYVQKRQGA